jgi:hypothetical protein
MTADQILTRMGAVYVACRSYRDSGTVRTRLPGPPGQPEFETDQPFRTAFARPDRFRFEFSYTHPGRTARHRYVVHTAGTEMRTWWDERPGIERRETLGLALAAAAGVSHGAAHTVPALLTPDAVGGRRLIDLTELARLEDGDLGEAGCYRLQGRPPAPAGTHADDARRVFREMTGMEPPAAFEPVVLWIDRATLLLRRVEARHRLPFGESVQAATYDPEKDVPIPDNELELDSPSG